MAVKLIVDNIPDGGGPIDVRHEFYAATKYEATEKFRKHAEGCERLGPAVDEGRTHSEFEEIDDDDWPAYDPN